MAYAISYASKKQPSRIPKLTAAFFLLFLAGVLAAKKPAIFWPEAVQTVAEQIEQGSSLWQAAQCFCTGWTEDGQ